MTKNIKVFIFAIAIALVLSVIYRQIFAGSIEANVLVSMLFAIVGSKIGGKIFSEGN